MCHERWMRRERRREERFDEELRDLVDERERTLRAEPLLASADLPVGRVTIYRDASLDERGGRSDEMRGACQ